jgi:hypothetical protein
MKNTLITTALVAIVGLAFVGAPMTAQAQTTNSTTATAPTPAKKTNKINYNGAVTAIDTTANTITVDSKSKKDGDKTLVLSVTATTTIKRDKVTATLADFKVGEKVTGSYVTEASGTLTAAKLTFTTPKAKTPKKPATTTTAATTNAPAATPPTQ